MTRIQDAAPPPAVYASRSTLHAPRSTFAAALALSLLLGLGSATAANTPYQGIVERNVFGLKPPPPPPDPEALQPPPSKILLTGIMTIFGKKQALMETPPSPAPPPRPGQHPAPTKEHSYMLAEGQAEDAITVLQIDTVAKTVKVDNAGHIETLAFSTNAPPSMNAGAPSPTGFGRGGPMPNFPRIIPRPLRIPTAGVSPSGSSTYSGGAVNSGLAAGAVPGGYGGASQRVGDQVASAPQRSLEENVLLYEANRLKNEQLIQSGVHLPPMPPHPMAAGMYGDGGQGQAPAQSPRLPYIARPGMPQPMAQ